MGCVIIATKKKYDKAKNIEPFLWLEEGSAFKRIYET
jgi:hypothetical protein